MGSPDEAEEGRSPCPSNPVIMARRYFRVGSILLGMLGLVFASMSLRVTTTSPQVQQPLTTAALTLEHELALVHFDINAPPVPMSDEERAKLLATTQQREQETSSRPGLTVNPTSTGEFLSRSTSTVVDEQNLPIPIIYAEDDEIPIAASVLSTRAADALECRESVISFVINATDGKDECDGLKRAFDKTCSGESSNKLEATQAPIRQRRRLFDNKPKNWSALMSYKLSRALHRVLRIFLFSSKEDCFFFAEEQVSGSAWMDAKYLVENDLDRVVHEKTRRKLTVNTEARLRRLQENVEDKLNEPATEDHVAETTIPPKSEKPKDGHAEKHKQQSLSLPTANEHLTGQALTEALMLQKDQDVIAALKVSSNQTNATLSAAQADAKASSKAVSDTTAAVSAVLNDPDSVEARVCCASILNVFHENCDVSTEEVVSDRKLFIIIFIIAFCGMVKSLIRHFQIRWLPEAGGCILVGVLSGAFMSFIPHYDFSFDGDWFLRIMVPPIVFEAALSIDKKSFNRHVVPILIYAVVGTLLATVITAYIVHRGTSALGSWCETIPYVESLTFGALISSIDPIAVLSVLSNMGMTDTDTIYVVIFGESLLNDGVAIVLFHTLVHFLDESLVIDSEAVTAAAIHFFVVAIGSVLVGFMSGIVCTLYFWAFHGCQTALVEVLMFFCWAFLPYYICDGVGWSGIVAIVTTGFVMDLYVVGPHASTTSSNEEEAISNVSQKKSHRGLFLKRAFSKRGHLSAVARTHVGFVTEILSTMMETAIFAYLGYFLFSYRYHWNFWHTCIAVFACCASRAIMIPSLSLVANWASALHHVRNNCRPQSSRLRNPQTKDTIIDYRMQLVLWFAGLRGAMSFALVENIPLYDTVTGEGSRLKPEMKAMTSASIVFTVFVLGGYTYYVIERLGMAPSTKPTFELVSLLPTLHHHHSEMPDDNGDGTTRDQLSYESQPSLEQTFRQRQKSESEAL